MVQAYYTNPAGNIPPLDTLQERTFNFAYPTTRASYSGSEMRQPIGSLTWFNQTVTPTSVEYDGSVIPVEFELFANYPNPFNPETTIKYALPAKSPVFLSIFTMLGQRVATLVNEPQEPGTYSVRWNGVDEQGGKVSSGMYLYQLTTRGTSLTRKMILLK